MLTVLRALRVLALILSALSGLSAPCKSSDGQRVGISELSKPSYEYQFLSTGYDLLLMHADTVVSFVDERGDYIMVIDARVQIPHGIIYEDKKEGLEVVADPYWLVAVHEQVDRGELPVGLS